jgi:hypothetical protein
MRFRRLSAPLALLTTLACNAEIPPSDAVVANSGSEPVGVTGENPQRAELPQPIDLVDPAIPPAVAGEGGWGYFRVAEADLSGRGEVERVVLTARVEMIRGQPAWDDGQPWQAYVEAPDGSRTYLYAQRLQLGSLDMRITRATPDGLATLVLIEHLPDRFSIYEVAYRGPREANATVQFRRDVDPTGELASPRFP